MKQIQGLVVVVLMMLPVLAAAHGAGYEPVDRDAAGVRFAYVLGEPMTGAEVRVVTPETGQTYQVGRVDRDGRFAFVPDRPGEWRVIADDGAGHRVEAVVEVAADGVSVAAPTRIAVSPSVLLVLLVVSVLLNAGLLSVLLAKRGKTKTTNE